MRTIRLILLCYLAEADEAGSKWLGPGLTCHGMLSREISQNQNGAASVTGELSVEWVRARKEKGGYQR
jgi:hypothetical protein